jgi:hypothetical protein
MLTSLPKSLPMIVKVWLPAMLFAVVHVGLVTRNVTFSYAYHWDEGGKARQVVSGKRNLNHPPLMLNVARVVHRAAGSPASLQETTVLGRKTVALFAAVAIAVFVLLAYAIAGQTAMWLTGVLLISQPMLFRLSHYFKEDAVLLFGWGLCLWAYCKYHARPRRWSSVFLGVAVGVAMSAKYIGVLPAVCAIAMGGWTCARSDLDRREKVIQMVVLLSAIVVFVMIADFQVWLDQGIAVDSIRHEVRKQYSHNTGVGNVFALLVSRSRWPVIALSAIMILQKLRRRDGPMPLLVATVVPSALLLAVLSTVDRLVPRYILPIVITLEMLAALGACSLAEALRRRRPSLGAKGMVLTSFLFALPVLYVQVGAMRSEMRAFSAPDPRKRLVRLVAEEMPDRSLIACDLRILLPGACGAAPGDADDGTEQQFIQIPRWNRGEPIMEWLKRENVTHVAVSRIYADHYLGMSEVQTKGQFSDAAQRGQFYRELFREADLVWESEPSVNNAIAPHIQLYALPPSG